MIGLSEPVWKGGGKPPQTSLLSGSGKSANILTAANRAQTVRFELRQQAIRQFHKLHHLLDVFGIITEKGVGFKNVRNMATRIVRFGKALFEQKFEPKTFIARKNANIDVAGGWKAYFSKLISKL